MSEFAGCFHFDGAPVDRRSVWAMGQTIASRAPDGGNDYCCGSLGMSYRAFHTTPESRREAQPMRGSLGEILCWDGRLDNRDELQAQLSCARMPSDAEIVIAAYEKWGEESLARLVGDFALAIFDPRERQILLGRDFFGPRPLFYLLQAEQLIWSTSLLPLMQQGATDLALDDDYVAQFLVMGIDPQRTPYRNLRAVEPGRAMLFRRGRLARNQRFWQPDPSKEIRYKTDREYEENFSALFRQSVKARLRSAGPVWADLSGGLDSSAIVCMADRIIARENVDCPRLDTWTVVQGESLLTNELQFVEMVEARRGRSGFHFQEDELWFHDMLREEYRQTVPNALACIPQRTARLNQLMSAAGARVRLNGHGGDHLLGNSGVSPEPADFFRSMQFRRLHRQLQVWSRSSRQPYLKTLLKNAVLPALPAPLRERFESSTFLRQSLPKKFRERFSRVTFLAYPPDPFGHRRPSSRERVRHLLAAIRTLAAGLYPEFAAFEIRYPYLDRRLVEWLLAVPVFEIQRPGETRSLMRRAFRNLLPPEIWSRKTKGMIDEGLCRGLNQNWADIEQLIAGARLARHGYFDPDYFAGAARSVAHGGSMARLVFSRLVALELWLRSIHQQGFQTRPAPVANAPAPRDLQAVSFAKE